MRVHLFGAVSSPSCANFAFRQTAKDHSAEHGGSTTQNTIDRHFYLDDCLKSVKTAEEAIQLIQNVIAVCKKGGFHLTKFVSNKESVIKSIPAEDRASDTKAQNLTPTLQSRERALGILWNTQTDTLCFKMAA